MRRATKAKRTNDCMIHGIGRYALASVVGFNRYHISNYAGRDRHGYAQEYQDSPQVRSAPDHSCRQPWHHAKVDLSGHGILILRTD